MSLWIGLDWCNTELLLIKNYTLPALVLSTPLIDSFLEAAALIVLNNTITNEKLLYLKLKMLKVYFNEMERFIVNSLKI